MTKAKIFEPQIRISSQTLLSPSHKTKNPSYSLWLTSTSMAGLGGEIGGERRTIIVYTYPPACGMRMRWASWRNMNNGTFASKKQHKSGGEESAKGALEGLVVTGAAS
jgi:hypothetical protein